MKFIIAYLALACAASAASLPQVLERDSLAICNAQKGTACSYSGEHACENNGGHSMVCVAVSPGKFQFIYADNCPDSNAHCDCATGLCAPN
ncbi:hypothetical protein ACEQ8H_005233 [Pleosporales sp. CAS-2024a]